MNSNIIHDIFLQKVADISGVPVEYVMKLRDKGMLDQQRTRELLMRHDYYALHRSGKIKKKLIVQKLANFYQVSLTSVYKALHINTSRIFFCKRCGIQLSKDAYEQGDGLCGKCISNSINL